MNTHQMIKSVTWQPLQPELRTWAVVLMQGGTDWNAEQITGRGLLEAEAKKLAELANTALPPSTESMWQTFYARDLACDPSLPIQEAL